MEPPSALKVKGSRGSMLLCARANSSVPNVEARRKRGDIAADKYEGVRIFKEHFLHSVKDEGNAAAYGIIGVRSEIWRFGMRQRNGLLGNFAGITANVRATEKFTRSE
jgi:hypothetical protein